MPVRQWVLSLPIPLRLLLAAQPELATSVLLVKRHAVTRHLLDGAQIKSDEGHGATHADCAISPKGNCPGPASCQWLDLAECHPRIPHDSGQ